MNPANVNTNLQYRMIKPTEDPVHDGITKRLTQKPRNGRPNSHPTGDGYISHCKDAGVATARPKDAWRLFLVCLDNSCECVSKAILLQADEYQWDSPVTSIGPTPDTKGRKVPRRTTLVM